MGDRPWYRLPLCWASLCGFKAECDDTGCWGECITCHRRVGFVDRATLRRVCDAEAAALELARQTPTAQDAGEGVA